MTPSEFGGALKRGELAGGYLFLAQEAYLATRYLEQVRKASFDDESLAAFNHFRFRASEATPEKLMDALQSLPVFCERKLIEIESVDFDAMTEGELEAYLSVFSLLPEYEYNTLILTVTPEELSPGTSKKPSARLAKLSEVLRPVSFEKQTPAKLNKWLAQHFGAWGVIAAPQECTFLIEYAGCDMYYLSAQADKLCCYLLAKGRNHLEKADILAAASPIDEYEAFALEDAILTGNCERALRVIRDKQMKKERAELVFAGISAVWQKMIRIPVMLQGGMLPKDVATKLKMAPFMVEKYHRLAGGHKGQVAQRALALCSAADAQIKQGKEDSYLIIERLLMETMLL